MSAGSKCLACLPSMPKWVPPVFRQDQSRNGRITMVVGGALALVCLVLIGIMAGKVVVAKLSQWSESPWVLGGMGMLGVGAFFTGRYVMKKSERQGLAV